MESMVLPGAVGAYSRSRHLSLQDAAQTFMQVMVLKHVSLPGARLMGGTALVLGYGSPRFSEDVDFAGVPDPGSLRPGLMRARTELEGWLGAKVSLKSPAAGRRTWRLSARFGRSDSLRLHVDSQPQVAHTARPLVIEFPSIPPFVVEGAGLDEIMSDKVIAAACRRYLGGRDLFDLWFHWLRSGSWEDRLGDVMELLDTKLEECSISREKIKELLAGRLSREVSLSRARAEWKRYLPAEFQKPIVLDEIVSRCRLLAGLMS